MSEAGGDDERRTRAAQWIAAAGVTLGMYVWPLMPRVEAQEKQAMPAPHQQQSFAQAQEIPRLIAEGRLSPKQIPNPHWRADGCPACHRGTPTKSAVKLRDTDMNRLCNTCHEAISPHSYIHPVGMTLSREMESGMPKSFQQAVKRDNGKLTCNTCHDLPMQCLPARTRERGLNPLFFRDGPFKARTELCYRCHQARAYARLNPHDQLSDTGVLREDRCLVCHQHVPDRTGVEDAREVDFTVTGDLSSLCTGCHLWIPHPGGAFSFSSREGPNHLVVPSDGVARRMQRMQREHNITLPLDPHSGKVTCGTCHNAHEQGVLPAAAGKGADSKARLRGPDMCGLCHEK
jgi:predicted CXXCH cytochrome family protein